MSADSQYTSELSEQDPDEKIQPQTIEDKTSKTTAETAKEYLGYSTTKAILAVLLTVAAILLIRRFFPRIYYSGTVRLLVAAAIYTGILGTVMYRSGGRQALNHDELAVHLPGGAKRYYGEFSEDSDGNQTFTPYKGFSFFYNPIPLEWQDINTEAVSTYAKRDKESGDAVVLGLNEAITNTTYTDTGVAVTAHSSGMEVDGKGFDRDLRLAMPHTVDRSEFDDIRQLLEKYETQTIPEMKSENTTLRRRLDDAVSELREIRESALEDSVDNIRQLSDAFHSGKQTEVREVERRPGSDD